MDKKVVISEMEEIELEVDTEVEKDYLTPKKEKSKTVRKPKKVTVTFRGTRKFELYIDRKVFIFNGRETKEMDISDIEHPDFQNVRKYFTIKGIGGK